MRTANEAIDGILANAAFDDRRLRLKKQYKAAERQAKLLGARVTARAENLTESTSNLTGLVNTINSSNKQVQAAATAWEQAQKKAQAQWQEEFLSKAKFNDLGKKERQKAWEEYVARQAKRLPEYNVIRDLQAQGKINQSQYTTQAAAVAAQRERYEGMVKRQKQAYRRYEQAVARYNKFTSFVPYRPA